MRINEVVGAPADQQGKSGVGSLPPLSKSGANMQQQMQTMNNQNAGIGQKTPGNGQQPNDLAAQRAKQDQKKQIQNQIVL